MKLRKIFEEDFQFLAEKYVETFSSEPWNEELEVSTIREFIQKIYSMNTFIGFIAEEEESKDFLGLALGYIKPWYQGEEYLLDTFLIDNQHQSKGYGSLFLKLIKKELRDRNIPAILLDTDKGMPAETFYKNNGFEAADSSILMFCGTKE